MGPLRSAKWGDDPARDGLSPVAATLWAAALGAAVTAVIMGTPLLLYGYRSPSAHLVLETANSSIALLVAYLFYGRFRRSRRVQDLLLLQGLILLAVAGLGLTVVVNLVQDGRTGVLDVWLPLAVRVLGAALIAAASLIPQRRVRSPTLRFWALVPATTVVVGLFVVLSAVESQLPTALDQRLSPDSAVRPDIAGHPILVMAQVLITACFAVACIAFTRQAQRGADELLVWLGPACALATFARLNYVLYPSMYTDWIYTGDFLRTGFYLLLAAGAAREIQQYWAGQALSAVVEDRRRLARELHDGVLQELGYIRVESRELCGVDAEKADKIIAACDRAVDEARSAVDVLGRADDEPLGFVLHRAARQVAERYGLALELDLDDSVGVGSAQRHALVRIVREALSNAARHGRGSRAVVRLRADASGGRLTVRDDGVGFDLGTAGQATGFGLISMRERATALPGSFELDSAPGRGTTVTVRWW